uniref:Secreted protein n=1 Tax=Arundo donax TaxID=35708 RepID=A0A0A9ECN1_ARUDO
MVQFILLHLNLGLCLCPVSLHRGPFFLPPALLLSSSFPFSFFCSKPLKFLSLFFDQEVLKRLFIHVTFYFQEKVIIIVVFIDSVTVKEYKV